MEAKPSDADREKARRARIARAERLLGNLLPTSGEDASALDWGEERESRSRDDELRRDLPPHHGKD